MATTQEEPELQTLEPDLDNDDDDDSSFGGETDPSVRSASIASSVLNYEYENGRRYHGFRKGEYVLPNDEKEQERLDLMHHVFLMVLGGKLFHAPISENPKRVLDIGTGTGVWAIEFADDYPSTQVIGNDLSPIQPSWVPPNVQFYVDDIETEWAFTEDEAFDLIHSRSMGGSIADWDKFVANCYQNIKPGGWVELQEVEANASSDDDSLSRTKNCNLFQQKCGEAARTFGKDLHIAQSLKQRVIDAGFVDVREEIIKVPWGPWPKDKKQKEIGRYFLEHLCPGVESYGLGFLGKVLKWDETECRVLIDKVNDELRDRRNHLYTKFHVVMGRKPE